VELPVQVTPGAALIEKAQLEPGLGNHPVESDLRLITEPTLIQIDPSQRSKAEVAPLLAAAKEWNVRNGFSRAQESKSREKKDRRPSWWHEKVSGPLGKSLQERFGRKVETKSEIAGNLGLSHIRLSKLPGKQIVVTVAFKSGDKSISLVEGSRLVFDDQNWDKPAIALVQLDPKLRHTTAATFEVRAGNVPFSWSVSFAVLTGMFLFFGIYHKFILPYPVSDRP